MRHVRVGVLLLVATLSLQPVAAQQAPGLAALLDATELRNIGPFRTSAWVTDISVPETPLHEHLYTVYAASRSGGLWKTTNNGITWKAVTDGVDVAAVGAVEVAPSDADVVWLGTGANDLSRSSYSGKGVYRSTDAGASWQDRGLHDTQHIARIVVHPTDPDTAWVAAMGHLFSANEQRGVFRTRDGGETWDKVLYVDDTTGAADLVIDRDSPDILYAAMYEKVRRPWELVLGGPGSGIYRSTDGGDTWTRLEGGLPSGDIGRIGLDLNQESGVLTAIVENVNPRPEGWPERHDACSPEGRVIGGDTIGNEVYRSSDGGDTWSKSHDDGIDVAGSKAPYSFNEIATDPSDPDHIVVISDSMYESKDGGSTWSCDFFRGVFGDYRTIWWDSQDPRRIMLGSDGGVNVSYDGGATGDYSVNIPIGEVYAVGVDNDDPYHVYAGLQDHDSWKGPSNARSGRITLEDWTTVGTGDGMYNRVDPTDSRWVYNTLQTGGQRRFDQRTGRATSIEPVRDEDQPRLRYNWITPLVLSPHNPRILYTGAQVLFRSLDRGDHWREISPDLTSDDDRCGLNSGYVPYCTISTISESPAEPGVIWVGTDDGKVQLTRDGGSSWSDVTASVAAAGGPADRYVSRVFASPHDAGTAFVAKNGFRRDDFHAYLLRTTDFGGTWESIAGGLPEAPVNVVYQDPANADLLLVGNDLGVWVSIDGGAGWTRMRANLPTVPVHDLTLQSRDDDVVLGTYGRALWVGDVSALRQATPEILAGDFHLFAITPRPYHAFRALGNFHLFGDRYISVPNEADGLRVEYWLGAAADGEATITVADVTGAEVARLAGPAEAGLNRALWDMRPGTAPEPGDRRAFFERLQTPPLPPGDYNVTVRVGGHQASTVGTIRERPAHGS